MCHTLLKHVDALTDVCLRLFDDEYRRRLLQRAYARRVTKIGDSSSKIGQSPDTAPDIVSELADCVGH
jgi:hypothetical protein